MNQAEKQWLRSHRHLSALLGLSLHASFVPAPCTRLTGITDSKSQSTSLCAAVTPGVVDGFTFVAEISTPLKSQVGKQLLSRVAFSYQAVNGSAAFL